MKTTNEIKNMKPTFAVSTINKKENNKTKGKVSIKNPRKWKL
jgi:outer membrane lipoprotein-sorting protein